MSRRVLSLFATLALMSTVQPALAQAAQPSPAKAAPSAEQIKSWQQLLGQFTMAAVWLRRCPTERVFRQLAATNAERILSETFHQQGLTEPQHLAAKDAGRDAAIAPCTDETRAKFAAVMSANAFLILTAGTPDLSRIAELALLTGVIDDSPCGVARGNTFQAKPNQMLVLPEIERARAQVGEGADSAIETGKKIRAAYSSPEVCKATKGWTPVIIDGWQDMFSDIQNAEKTIEEQKYGHYKSAGWRIEAQRGKSLVLGTETGVRFDCQTVQMRFEETEAIYTCEMSITASRKTLVAEVKPLKNCDEAKCLVNVTQVRLQLFADKNATAPLQSFSGKSDGKGNYSFPATALAALNDPNQPAKIAYVTVSGVTKAGKTVADGNPVRGDPPGFPLIDFQDAYSWAFAPDSIAATKS